MPKREIELEMARRHLAEAEKHIARQEAIIAEMVLHRHPYAASMGERLLETMRFYLANAKAHVDRLERRDIFEG